MEVILTLTIRELKLIMRKKILLCMLLTIPLIGVATVAFGAPSGLMIYFYLPASALLITAIELMITEKYVLITLSACTSSKTRLISWAFVLLIVLLVQSAIFYALLAMIGRNSFCIWELIPAILISLAIGITLYLMVSRKLVFR